ncbi:MAG: cob(I)yrinic acid a,c-diamide adenosyltransferase [Planctomycetota bacterium]
MSITTGKGDGGQSSYIGGDRSFKDEARFEAYGTVDELSAAIGTLRCCPLPDPIDEELRTITEWLFSMGADLATPGAGREGKATLLPPASNDTLLAWIHREEADLPPLRHFILPGGSPAAAACHVARTVCRRAERRVVTLMRATGEADRAVIFLNRLSDLLFLYARHANRDAGVPDVEWHGNR